MIKDTTESNTSASYWICSCQTVGTVNFALPFTTSVTISISILQTICSWVATSLLRPPIAFLSRNSSDTPGLAPLMNDIWWGRCDFRISFSGRVMSRNVLNRLWGISMVGNGILSNNMRSPFPECYMIFWKMTIYSDTHHWSDITKMFDPVIDLDLITEFDFLPNCARGVHRIFTKGAACQQRTLTPPDTWSFHTLGLACF